MDDVLESRYDENGNLVANISFEEPTRENMGEFKRMLFIVRGKVRGGNIHRTEVLLTEENDYSEVLPVAITGNYETIGLDTERIRVDLGEAEITLSKSPNLTTPGTYNTVVAFVGESWAEMFVVTIMVTVPLRVRHNNVDHTNGQTLTINVAYRTTAPNYPSQYLNVFGSRNWTLEEIEEDKILATPLSGTGRNNSWESTMITLSKPPELVVSERITTTFRIFAQTQWVDVIVHFLPPIHLQFVDPDTDEVGAPGGMEPVYVYL